MALDSDILRTLREFAKEKPTEDGVVRALVADGMSRLLAEKLVALVPLAFGRVLISHIDKVEFPKTARLSCRDGSSKSYDLLTDEIFLRSLRIATAMYHEGPRDLFGPAATASAELNAVNAALNADSDLSRAQFSEIRFLRISYEEWTASEHVIAD